jgi:hypothetical protein
MASLATSRQVPLLFGCAPALEVLLAVMQGGEWRCLKHSAFFHSFDEH